MYAIFVVEPHTERDKIFIPTYIVYVQFPSLLSFPFFPLKIEPELEGFDEFKRWRGWGLDTGDHSHAQSVEKFVTIMESFSYISTLFTCEKFTMILSQTI